MQHKHHVILMTSRNLRHCTT